MSKNKPGMTSKAAETAKSTARSAASKSGRAAKTVHGTARKAAKGVTAAKPGRIKNKSVGIGIGIYKPIKVKSGTKPENPFTIVKQTGKPPRVATPVEQAALTGVTTRAQDDGTLIADDTDVLRIARAIAEHRKGLMDRLAK